MAQHLLNGAQIRPILQQMGSKGVAQGVGRDVLVNLRLLLVVFNDLPEPLPAHALAAHIHKERRLPGRQHQLGPYVPNVVRQRLHRRRVQGDDPLLSPADAPDEPRRQIHVLHVQPDQLADPDARGVQQLQHGVVPVALGVHALGLLQKQIHLLAREDLGQLPLRAHRRRVLGRVGPDHALAEKVAVKALQGGHAPGHAGSRLAPAGHIGYVPLNVLLGALKQLRLLHLLEVAAKLGYVSDIGCDRVVRGAPLQAQIGRVFPDIICQSSPLPSS